MHLSFTTIATNTANTQKTNNGSAKAAPLEEDLNFGRPEVVAAISLTDEKYE